jgi:hypothetical protein
MITRLDKSTDSILGFTLSGKLHDEDYKNFVPAVDAAIVAHGRVRLLAHFVDFHGWDMHALWDDIKFSTTHCNKIDRIALVGDKSWEKAMAQICKPFTMARIQYFDASRIADAWKWLEEPA